MNRCAWFAVCLLQGCAVLPNTIGPFVQHDSHLTQHRPFTDDTTDYGANLIGIDAHWRAGPVTVDLSEALNLQGAWSGDGHTGHGELLGPRESFEARVGYGFTIR